MKRIKKTIHDTAEIHNISFEQNPIPRVPPNRKRARPKYTWTERAMLDCWEQVRAKIPDMINTTYDEKQRNNQKPPNRQCTNILNIYAHKTNDGVEQTMN